MSDATLFITRFMVFALLHSLLAIPGFKRFLARGHDGEPRWFRLAYNLLSLVLMIWMMAAWRSSPVLYFAPGIISLLMYALQAAVLAALTSCLCQTGISEFLGVTQLRRQPPPAVLQTGGWYGLVRHPLYLLSTAFMLLAPVMTAQWLILSACSFIYFQVGAIIEERRLLALHGEAFRQYCRTVPFLVPGWHRFRKPSPRR